MSNREFPKFYPEDDGSHGVKITHIQMSNTDRRKLELFEDSVKIIKNFVDAINLKSGEALGFNIVLAEKFIEKAAEIEKGKE